MRTRSSVPRFYFSFRSPYSWLTYRDLQAHHRDLLERLAFVPFWEPDAGMRAMLEAAGGTFPYTHMSRAKAFYILEDVRRLARGRDIVMAWPVDRDPWWEVPHLAYLVAAAHGCGHAFIDRVYHARWEEGSDICQPTSIARIAAGLGLDPREHAEAASNEHIRARALRLLMDIDSDGVFGVPFLVHGRNRFWGLDRLAEFRAALDAVDALDALDCEGGVPHDPPEPIAAEAFVAAGAEAGADQGHAGGCG